MRELKLDTSTYYSEPFGEPQDLNFILQG